MSTLDDVKGLPPVFRKIKALLTSLIARITATEAAVSTLTGISSGELGVLDGVVPGTAAASKALVLDANKDIAGVGNLTADNVVVGNNGVIQVLSPTAGQGSVSIFPDDNAGNTSTDIFVLAQAGGRQYDVPDAGATAAQFCLNHRLVEAANAVAIAAGATSVVATAGTTVVTPGPSIVPGVKFEVVCSSTGADKFLDFGVGATIYGAGLTGVSTRYIKIAAASAIGSGVCMVQLGANTYMILSSMGTVTLDAPA